MNLVQKMPAVLGIAFAVFMSSCSKEDLQSPAPMEKQVNQHSNLRAGTGLMALFNFPTTEGPAGFDIYATSWSRSPWQDSNTLLTHPAGTSSLTHLWGNNQLPWTKPLPKIASIPAMRSVVTVSTSRKIEPGAVGYGSSATATIEHLKVGKKYEITFYVATTTRSISGFSAAYPKQIYINVANDNGWFNTFYDMTGKEAEWVKGTINFIATTTEYIVSLGANVAETGQFGFAHIYVDKDSIHQIN